MRRKSAGKKLMAVLIAASLALTPAEDVYKRQGIAYVLDVDNVLYKNLNKAMISIEKVDNKYDKKELRDLIEAHVEATGSEIGKKVLADFDSYLPHFKKLIPDEYKLSLIHI